jgi:cytochrome subunit of sulfide dehydrogenase
MNKKNIHKNSLALVMLLTLLNSAVCSATAPAKYITDCMDCHGKEGFSPEPDMPTIAGASAAFIEATLFAYKDDIRPAVTSKYRFGDTNKPATDMKKVVEALTDQQLSEVANFFANKPFIAAKQAFDQTLVATGKAIHDNKCKRCHNKGGRDPDDDSGILAGQHSLYLQQSVQHYLDGSREMDRKMRQVSEQLTAADWEALIAYYASQQ